MTDIKFHFSFQVSWHIVFSGIFLQVMFGLIILRWKAGFQAFEWFGDKAVGFLDFTNFGSDFVFGEQYGFLELGKLPSWMKHGFAMQVLIVHLLSS